MRVLARSLPNALPKKKETILIDMALALANNQSWTNDLRKNTRMAFIINTFTSAMKTLAEGHPKQDMIIKLIDQFERQEKIADYKQDAA